MGRKPIALLLTARAEQWACEQEGGGMLSLVARLDQRGKDQISEWYPLPLVLRSLGTNALEVALTTF